MARAPKFTKWRHLANAVAANAGDIPHLAPSGQQLTGIVDDGVETVDRQNAFAASKQDESQRLVELEANGAKLATFIATGVRQHYGNRAEKLTEFGLRPFRGGRPRVIKPPVPEAAKVEPADDPEP